MVETSDASWLQHFQGWLYKEHQKPFSHCHWLPWFWGRVSITCVLTGFLKDFLHISSPILGAKKKHRPAVFFVNRWIFSQAVQDGNPLLRISADPPMEGWMNLYSRGRVSQIAGGVRILRVEKTNKAAVTIRDPCFLREEDFSVAHTIHVWYTYLHGWLNFKW